jgi:hypothetical protein
VSRPAAAAIGPDRRPGGAGARLTRSSGSLAGCAVTVTVTARDSGGLRPGRVRPGPESGRHCDSVIIMVMIPCRGRSPGFELLRVRLAGNPVSESLAGFPSRWQQPSRNLKSQSGKAYHAIGCRVCSSLRVAQSALSSCSPSPAWPTRDAAAAQSGTPTT